MYKPLLSLVAATVLLAGCETKKSETKDTLGDATRDTAVMARDGRTAGNVAGNAAVATKDAAASGGAAIGNAWTVTKDKVEDLKFKELNLTGVSVRGDADYYNVYSVDEAVLFDTDKVAIKPSAAKALQQITGSIGQRFSKSGVRVMGSADSHGDKNYNKDLSEKRADAVKNCLVATGKIDAGRVSVEPMGEAQPVTNNTTAAGRKENRRVEIAVRTH